MKYLIYAAIALLVIWAIVYLIRHIRRQLKGDCGCGQGAECAGNCGSCCRDCHK